eukprot:COSAG06_NODE_56009_length_287_cov_0.159574_1_plen_61_part_10
MPRVAELRTVSVAVSEDLAAEQQRQIARDKREQRARGSQQRSISRLDGCWADGAAESLPRS